jgi:hypothetical protein
MMKEFLMNFLLNTIKLKRQQLRILVVRDAGRASARKERHHVGDRYTPSNLRELPVGGNQ